MQADVHPHKHIWLLSDARSGSTWASSVLNFDGRFSIYFEPCHADFSPELQGEPLVRYSRIGHLPRSYSSLYCDILDRRISRERLGPINPGQPSLLIKDVNALLIAGAVVEQLPALQAVCLVRDPMEVAASKMRLSNWRWATIEELLQQQDLVDDWLAPHLDLLRSSTTMFQKHVAVWGAMYFVATRQLGGRAVLLSYRQLRADPIAALSKVYGVETSGMNHRRLMTVHRARSFTSNPNSPQFEPTREDRDYCSRVLRDLQLEALAEA